MLCIQRTNEKLTIFAFSSLYIIQKSDLERTLSLKIDSFDFGWLEKKNNLTRKISLLLMKADVCPRDFFCPPDKRRECLYREFPPSDWQDRFCLFSFKGDFQTFDTYFKRLLYMFACHPMYVFWEWAYLWCLCLILSLSIPFKIHSKGNQNPVNGQQKKIICNWDLESENLCVKVYLHFVIFKIHIWGLSWQVSG